MQAPEDVRERGSQRPSGSPVPTWLSEPAASVETVVPRPRAGVAEFTSDIRCLVDSRPGYGYRRIVALLKLERRSAGHDPVKVSTGLFRPAAMWAGIAAAVPAMHCYLPRG